MRKIAKTNGTEFTTEMSGLLIKAEEEEKDKVSPLKIISSGVMAKHLILVCILSYVPLN